MAKPSDAYITAFERHYDTDWNDSSMRNERLGWIACWKAATTCQGCVVTQGAHKPAQAVHQIAEPAPSVDKQIGEVMVMVGDFGDACEVFCESQTTDSGNRMIELKHGIRSKLRTLVSGLQKTIVEQEALLKFADARINLLMGQAEGAQSGGQGSKPVVFEPAPAPALEVPRSAASQMQPVVISANGVHRFKENRIVRSLVDHGTNTGFGLNEIAFEAARGKYDAQEQMQLAQLIGYSVSGYGTLSYVTDESYEQSAAASAALLVQSKGADIASSQTTGEANPAFYFDMEDDDEDGASAFHTVKECIEYTVERRELGAGAVVSVGFFHKEDGEDKEPDFHCSVEIISNDSELENQPVWEVKPSAKG